MRQLNFYNFRKVNRERNFWVYKHPLFQRERPQDLHLLRRRTCPGVDGRKVRPDAEHGGQGYEPKSVFSPTNVLSSIAVSPYESSDSDEGGSIAVTAAISKKRKTALRKKSDASLSSSSEDEHPPKSTKTSFMVSDQLTVLDKKQNIESVHEREPNRLVSPLSKPASSQLDMKEQSVLVSKVSKQLDEHAKKAAAIMGKNGMKTRTGDITPTYVSSTMRYNALTYDDEIEIFDSARGCVVEKNLHNCVPSKDNDASDDGSENSATVVSFTDYELQDSSKRIISAPIEDTRIIIEVRKKLLDVNNNISHLTTAIAEFCMTTDPHDPFLGEKAIQLMSNHAELAQEFCRYKIALSPNNSDHSEFMRALFSGQSKETVRGFKTFVLNSLKDLVRETKSWNEFAALSQCYNVWFSGVSLSALA